MVDETGGGGIVKRTVFQFDFDLSTANKSNEQLVEMQKRLRSEVEKTEKQIQNMINEMTRMKMSGEFSGGAKEDFFNLGAEIKRLQDFSRAATRTLDEIDIQFTESAKNADLFANETKQGMDLVRQEAKKTQSEIAKISKEFEKGTAEAKTFAAAVSRSKDQAAADLSSLLGTYTFGPITPTKMARGKPSETQGFQAELFDFGNAVEMAGGASRLPTYSEELAQFEQFIRAVTKAEPILVGETQTIREYAVQMDNLSTATIRVRKILDEFGNIKYLDLDKQVLPELNEFSAKALKLQQDGYKFFATIEDGTNVTKLFAKVIDGTVRGVARLSGELDVVTGDLKRVNGGVADTKADFQRLFEMLMVAGSSGTITSFLPEEQFQMMKLFLGQYASEVGALTKKQERDFRQAADAFQQNNMRMIQSAEQSESEIASAMNRTTATIEAQVRADQDIIDVTPVMVEAVEKQAVAQEKLQAQLNQTQAELDQTQKAMQETAAAGAVVPPTAGRMTAFGVVPPTGGGGGRGGGADEFGGRSNPAMEFRNEIAMAMEELQRITNVRDFPGLSALQKEIDILRQKLILLADESRMGLVTIESAGQQAEEYVMTAREFTGLWNGINRVALEIERADKSFKSFGEMKPGMEAQTFFNELDRTLKNLDAQFKRGEISGEEFYRRLQLIGEAIGTTGKRADIYSSALSRAFKAMQTEKAAEFRKALSQINIELLKGGKVSDLISRLEVLKKQYSGNAQAVERLEKTITKLKAIAGKNMLKEFNSSLEENRLEIKEGTQSLQQYLAELERAFAEWSQATKSMPEFGPRLRKEIAAVKSEIQTAKWKEFALELTRIQQEFREAPGAIEPFIQRLQALKQQWAGNEQAALKIDRVINQLQTSFARSNFGAFREQLAGIKAQFQAGEISAREWLEQLQALLAVVGTSGPAFNELARNIQAARAAADASAMREYKGAVQELTAQAAAGAITQKQLVHGLEALRPQVEGNAAAMQHLELAIAKARRGAGDMSVVLGTLGKMLKTAQHHAMWMLSGSLIMPLYNLPYTLLNTVKELDAAFTKLKTVLMLDPEIGRNHAEVAMQMNELKEAAFKIGMFYGEEIPKVSEVMFQVAQKYKKSSDIIVVSNQAIRLSLLDFTDNAEETSTQLMSLIAQFNLAPRDVQEFIDKVIVAGNAVRASAGEIMEGLTRSASMFKTIGADANEAIVLIAASLEKTGRSAEVVGTSWRNLSARMASITKVKDLMKEFGIEIYNEMQTAEDFAKTMENMRMKYATMTDEMKASFVSTVAGQRQLQTLIPVLEDMDGTIEKLTETIGISKEELASLVGKAVIEQTMSVERRIESVGVAFQYFWWQIAGDPKIKAAFIKFMFTVVDSLQWIQEHFNTIKTWVKLIGEYVIMMRLAALWNSRFGKAAVTAAGEVGMMNAEAMKSNMIIPQMGKNIQALGLKIKALGLEIAMVAKRFFLLYAAGEALKVLMYHFKTDSEKEMARQEAAMRAAEKIGDMLTAKGKGNTFGVIKNQMSIGFDALGLGMSPAEIKEMKKYLSEVQDKYGIYAEDFKTGREFSDALKKAIEAEISEKQSAELEKKFKEQERGFDKYLKSIEEKASKSGLGEALDPTTYLADDESARTGREAIDTYSSSVQRLKKEIDRSTASVDAFNKSIDSQRKTLQNIIDLAPYQIYGDYDINRIAGEFDDLFSMMNNGFIKNVNTAEELFKKLNDITALRSKIVSQNNEVIKQSKTISKSGSGGASSSLLDPWATDKDYKMTSGFGPRKRPKKGASSNHKGYDYGVPSGTPLQAMAGGKVTFSGKQNGYGNVVIYEIGKGLEIAYAHLEKALVKKGQDVAPGQVIAKSGSTGVSTGPHLHLDYRIDGKKVSADEFNKAASSRGFGSVDVSDKAEKATDKMKTNLQELDSVEADLVQKIKDLYATSPEQFSNYIKGLGELDSTMNAVYQNLTQYQKEYYDWLLSTGQISLENWFDNVVNIHDNAAKQMGEAFFFDPKQVEESFMADPVRFRKQTGAAINSYKQQLEDVMKAFISGELSPERAASQFELFSGLLEGFMKRANYAEKFYENKMKPTFETVPKLREESLQGIELEIQYQEQYMNNQIESARLFGMHDKMLEMMALKEEILNKLALRKTRLLEEQLSDTTDINKKKEIENQLDVIANERAQAGLELAQRTAAEKNAEYDRAIMLRDVQYELMRIGATEEETFLINQAELQAKLADAYTKLQTLKDELSTKGIGTPEGLLQQDGVADLVSEIARLNLELYKLSPTMEAINRISKDAATNMVNGMKESIKAFVKGEQSFAQMLKNMVQAQSDAIQETIASSFAEAIAIKMTGEAGAFEKKMQDLSGAIFALFGLEAPDKRPVLEKIYDDSAKAIRVILAGDSAGGGDWVSNMVSGALGRKTGGTGGTGNPLIDAMVGGGRMTTKSSPFGKLNFTKQQQQGLYIGLAQYMGQGLAQSAAGPSAGQEGTSMATNLGATLGWGAGTATGGFFGSLGLSNLGAAAGPVGAILGMVIGGVASNAFGVGRGEQRRQAMAEQRANRQAEIDSIGERFGALGFDEEYIAEMAASVPDYIERSQRSRFGLSGTSRWLEGEGAVYAEIGRQKAMLDAMEKTVKGYNESVADSSHLLAIGTGRFDVFGKELSSFTNLWATDFEGGRVAVRVAGQTIDEYSQSLMDLSGAGGALLSPFINMNGQFNTMTDRIEMMTYWLNEMDRVGLGTTDTFQQLQEQLYALQQQKYWADIFQPLKEGEWLQQFGVTTDQDMLSYYQNAVKEAFGYQGELTENAIKDLAEMIAPEIGLLQTGQIEGFQAEDTQNRAELLQALWELTNKINDQNLAQAAVGSRTVGEAISGTAQIVQNDIQFTVAADNFFSTKTEMLNIAREFATMMKQQGWVDPAVFNI